LTTPPNVTAAATEASDAPARPMALSAILGTWGAENADFLAALEHKMGQTKKTITEAALWDMIADTWSADWGKARAHLGDAANDLFERQKPENVPLGSIGMALDAGELGKSEKRYREALAVFTVINEELRQDENLSRLMTAICDVQNTVDESLAISKQTQKLNNSFKVADKKKPRAKAEKKGLRAYVDIIFGRKPAVVQEINVAVAVTAEAAATQSNASPAPAIKA
jgi:hypothetical protein